MAQDLVGFQSRVAFKDNQPSSLSPIGFPHGYVEYIPPPCETFHLEGGFRGTAKFVGLDELIFIFTPVKRLDSSLVFY